MEKTIKEIEELRAILQLSEQVKKQEWLTTEGKLPEDLQKLEEDTKILLQKKQHELGQKERYLNLRLRRHCLLLGECLERQLKDYQAEIESSGNKKEGAFSETIRYIKDTFNDTFIKECKRYERVLKGLPHLNLNSIEEAQQEIEQAFSDSSASPDIRYRKIINALDELQVLLANSHQGLYSKEGVAG
jgi:hypothetical protein